MNPKISAQKRDSMTGQRMMVGIDGTEFSSRHRELIERFHVGGIILFARNVETPDQVLALCQELQACAASCGQPPLLISVDQEGGPVARLRSPHFTEFQGNPSIKNEADAGRFAEITAAELNSVGINMNMAPVLDVAPPEMESIMASRSFGGTPDQVAKLGCRVIRDFQRRGIMAVAKHFPGIGRTRLDSHLDMPVFRAGPHELHQMELIPFQAAIRENVSGVMLSHILYEMIDADWPASMSEIIVRKMLRGTLGYQGVVMTDDLDMGAVARHFDIRTAAARVVAADVDIALICHEGPAIGAAWEEIRRRISTDVNSRREAETAHQRILSLKSRYLGD